MSLTNYESTLRNIPDKQRRHTAAEARNYLYVSVVLQSSINFKKGKNIHITHSRKFGKDIGFITERRMDQLSATLYVCVCVCVCVCAANIVPFVPRCLKFRWFKTETI